MSLKFKGSSISEKLGVFCFGDFWQGAGFKTGEKEEKKTSPNEKANKYVMV